MIDRLLARLPDQQVGRHLLIEEGEHIIDLVRHHGFAYVKSAAWALLTPVMWLIAVFGPIALGWLFLLVGLAVAGWAAYTALAVRMDVFVITNLRVFRASGVFNVRIATMPISRILDITVEKPLLGRILGYGHFVFESAAQEQGLRDIRYIGRPDERDLTIQRVVQRSGLRGPRPQPY